MRTINLVARLTCLGEKDLIILFLCKYQQWGALKEASSRFQYALEEDVVHSSTGRLGQQSRSRAPSRGCFGS